MEKIVRFICGLSRRHASLVRLFVVKDFHVYIDKCALTARRYTSPATSRLNSWAKTAWLRCKQTLEEQCATWQSTRKRSRDIGKALVTYMVEHDIEAIRGVGELSHSTAVLQRKAGNSKANSKQWLTALRECLTEEQVAGVQRTVEDARTSNDKMYLSHKGSL